MCYRFNVLHARCYVTRFALVGWVGEALNMGVSEVGPVIVYISRGTPLYRLLSVRFRAYASTPAATPR
jgi:hypothetical protein